MWMFLAVLAIASAVVALLALLHAKAGRARFLQRAGLLLTGVFTFLGAAWIVGEAFTDPGGWQAVGLVALWLVPLAVLLAISWYRVALATVLLGALTAGMVGVSVWFAADPEAWRAFENNNGPVRAIGSFVLAAPIALLGWRRPLPAGVLLVVLGVVPVALSTVGTFRGIGSLAVVSFPPALTGILYLLAGVIARDTCAPPVVPTGVAKR